MTSLESQIYGEYGNIIRKTQKIAHYTNKGESARDFGVDPTTPMGKVRGKLMQPSAIVDFHPFDRHAQ
jgi:hypothetical protein